MPLDPRITRPLQHSASVLIVEDNPNMLFLAEKILQKGGYRVLKASNGQAAIDLYRQRKENIDIVLLDMSLPTISGRDVLLNLTSENPDVKVIVTSGYIEPDTLEVGRGRIELLHKPYTADQVLNALKNLIERAL